MTHRQQWLAALLALAGALLAPSVAMAATLGPSTPELPTTPVSLTLTVGAEATYRVSLVAGETLVLSLSPLPAQPTTLDLDLYLYGASATATNHAAALAKSAWPAGGYPETISYQAPTTGTYYIEVFDAEQSGQASLAWQKLPEPLLPVYRFYNNNTGTHFYTPSAEEADAVKAKWPTVFSYEGVAYYTKASKNTQPLYRFYNKRNGSHFYTASPEERDTVIAKWSSTFTYEGETYKVSPANDGTKAPVYRLYNKRNGSHFYTASAEEANTVILRWGAIYEFEGPAFFLGQ
jgi:hypothetical protein